MSFRNRKSNAKVTFGISLCCAAMLLSACEVPESTGVYSAGFGEFKSIFNQVTGREDDASELLRDPSAAGTAASAADDTVNDVTPLYAQYSYYLPSLSGKNKENFDALYKGIQNFEASISLPYPIKEDDDELMPVDDLMCLLLNECPELLQLDNTWKKQENILHSVTTVKPGYLLNQSEYRTQLLEIVAKVASWQTTLAGVTAFEAELAIFDEIVQNCVYSTTADYCQTAYGAIVGGEAKCDGRAKALVWGLRSLGITCSVITGTKLEQIF